MHGTLHFELSLWKTAAENLKKAQVVYENLVNALPEEEQILYKAKVSSTNFIFIYSDTLGLLKLHICRYLIVSNIS